MIVALVACGDPPPPEAPKPVPRQITPRAKLPSSIQPLVPQHGIYVAGGGLTSAAWRVVIDTDANTVFAGSSKAHGAPSFGKLDSERTNPLTPANKDHLMKMANDAWTEAAPATRPAPIADYDELLIISDGADTFYLQGFGPIRRPLAAKLIEELRAAGAL